MLAWGGGSPLLLTPRTRTPRPSSTPPPPPRLGALQYHPEASPGPHDADICFERYVEMMREERAAKVAA